MSKETFYFPHDYNSRHDRKLINVIMKHGMVGIGVYWCIVEMLYEEGGYLPLEYERITFELRTEKSVIQSIINDFELFNISDDQFYSEAVIERLQKRCEKSESARKSINYRWDKIKNSTNVLQSNVKRNTIKEKKGKEKKGKEKKEYSSDFLTFYSIYPKKIGRDAAWKAWKSRNGSLPDINIIIKSIEQQKKSDQWLKDNGQFIPNPATWINQGRWADEGIKQHHLSGKVSETTIQNIESFKEWRPPA